VLKAAAQIGGKSKNVVQTPIAAARRVCNGDRQRLD
jgi:hypothetical protein